jgi:purine-binding chemotaxis protein CheW
MAFTGRAAHLRAVFDRSFVAAREIGEAETADFISIRAAGDPYLLRLSQIAGFFVDKRITRLPNGAAELAGIAGFRGTMMPVYDLAALLGGAPAREPRWMVVAADAPVALTFESFERHHRLPVGAIAARDGASTGDLIRHVVRTGSLIQSVIDVPTVVAGIKSRIATGGRLQEH